MISVRFELTDKFLKASINNIELANEETNEEKLHLFKKVGSNFQIKDRTVLFEPRGAWRILAESGFCGGNAEQTALRADHIFGENSSPELLRCILEIARTECSPRPPAAGSDREGKKSGRFRIEN